MPSSRAISAIGRPEMRTNSTASRLNSGVNSRLALRCFSFMGTASSHRRCPASGGKSNLRKLRGKRLIAKPGQSRRYLVPPTAARTIAALLTLRDQVIGPILAGVRSPRLGRKPAHWTAVDRDYETLRIGMQTLFADLGIAAGSAAA